jgi:hypothetical protein
MADDFSRLVAALSENVRALRPQPYTPIDERRNGGNNLNHGHEIRNPKSLEAEPD